MNLIIIATSLVAVSLFGHLVHWSFHQPWSKQFHQSHMNHHLIQYPPFDLRSDEYRSAGNDDSRKLFLIAAIPLAIALLGLWFFNILSIFQLILISVIFVAFGFVNEFVHSHFHLEKSPLENLPGFSRLKELHDIHHLNMNKNFGIVSLVWDKVFSTFEENSK